MGLSNLAFAFGCFHFGLKKAAPKDLTTCGFITEVEKALKKVPNVDNVHVDSDPQVYDEPLTFSGERQKLNEGGWLDPFLPGGGISFDVLIPQGAQRELLKEVTSLPPLTYTERFHIDILYLYHSPVAVIQLIDPSIEPEPSDAIIVIRELLKREFARQQETFVDFQFLGPSPLHADFYLSAESEDRESAPWTFDLDIEHRRDYDRYRFSYNEEIFPDVEDALGVLMHDLSTELDLYYYTKWIENVNIFAWTQVEGLSWSLTELHQRRGLNGFIAKILRTTSLMNNAFVSLAEFESDSIFATRSLQNSYRHVYSSDSPPYLREIVDKEMEERQTYPTEQTKSLLQLYEARRLSSLELRVVVISALSGGAFGAVMTALLGGG